MTKVQFDTYEIELNYQFTCSMWSKEPGITKVPFNTQKIELKY